jgi:transmembrane sensor
VWLDRGEAYFDVAKDAKRAFTVVAGARRVVVLGTRFAVRREGDRLTVSVVEGRVRVEPAAPQAGSTVKVLTRGDIVVADGASLILAHRPVGAVVEQLSWRDGMLMFDQSTLGQAAAEFNRYNRKQVVVRGAAADVRIGGAFEAGNVDAFARLLRQAYGLKVTDTGSQVTVSS